LSLGYTRFEKKFGGTPKGRKEKIMMKILMLFYTFFDVLRIGGTPRKI
jgi:hypothetical protein